ncbi:MAG: Endonuclease, partial [Myxococcales bacterium]|nr:Endonuclease [Myxococcales bacterium]
MIACVDVDYRKSCVVAACVCFREFPDTVASGEHALRSTTPPHPYVSGSMYLRELPYLLEVLAPVRAGLRVAVVDAYVWLRDGSPGIGARLHETLGGEVAVVGIAKTGFYGASGVAEVRRGTSESPVFVSAAGMALADAAAAVASMAGPHRLPTFVKRADLLSRELYP